jgi:hypothetical protein
MLRERKIEREREAQASHGGEGEEPLRVAEGARDRGRGRCHTLYEEEG